MRTWKYPVVRLSDCKLWFPFQKEKNSNDANSRRGNRLEGFAMPRRSFLSVVERENLIALPETQDGLIQHYTLSEGDRSIIRQRRGAANRLGFAVLLCYLRFPGIILSVDQPPFPPLLKLVADQLTARATSLAKLAPHDLRRYAACGMSAARAPNYGASRAVSSNKFNCCSGMPPYGPQSDISGRSRTCRGERWVRPGDRLKAVVLAKA